MKIISYAAGPQRRRKDHGPVLGRVRCDVKSGDTVHLSYYVPNCDGKKSRDFRIILDKEEAIALASEILEWYKEK